MELKPQNTGLQVQAKKKTDLTKAQQALLFLINEKVKENKPLTIEDADEIHLKYVNKERKSGWQTGEITWGDWYTREVVTAWLLRNLGSLIIKGYLMVLPRIEITQTKKVLD